MKIWRTIKILWDEIQHVQLNVSNDVWSIENEEKYSLEKKLTKIYLRRAQEKTSLHYQQIFEKSIFIHFELFGWLSFCNYW